MISVVDSTDLPKQFSPYGWHPNKEAGGGGEGGGGGWRFERVDIGWRRFALARSPRLLSHIIIESYKGKITEHMVICKIN